MGNLLKYLLERLKEPSTWRGIVLSLTSLGVVLNEAQAMAIITAGLAITGLIGVFSPEKKAEVPK
jgi:hypothetical protein